MEHDVRLEETKQEVWRVVKGIIPEASPQKVVGTLMRSRLVGEIQQSRAGQADAASGPDKIPTQKPVKSQTQ